VIAGEIGAVAYFVIKGENPGGVSRKSRVLAIDSQDLIACSVGIAESQNKKALISQGFLYGSLAERVGFEPT